MKLDRTEFLTVSGLRAKTLEVWLEQRWIVLANPDDAAPFTDIDLARARLIRELQEDMGANDAGVDIILHLMDQLHGMRRAMRDLQAQPMSESPHASAEALKKPKRAPRKT